ncbi:hypothetical protein F441_04395 [Phytophthora nicotianae CJ01A1]|uniref:BED-type domain-containing protein n=2 Tax=Phytophthora nicotianae TaxID=4792 RepID=W2HCR8_PHYNI|nr:hypothetical protein L915_04305 [Phytophthora nicotianae]ETL98859.1 hypothetical protein L917_04144 [Phytophthora nicotianae]ETP22241.1 hypothetical protein F441_04395 [Phytophthora nicotianae CJ01A1]
MGQPASNERSEFVDRELDCGNNRTWRVCKHCHRAYTVPQRPDGTYTLQEPKKIKGRIENIRAHLKRCQNFIAHVQSRATTTSPTVISSTNETPGLNAEITVPLQTRTKRQLRFENFYPSFYQEEERKLFEQVLLELQADNNLPDTFIERKSTYRLLHLVHSMTIDVAPLPSRKKLGGKVLAGACEDDDTAALKE